MKTEFSKKTVTEAFYCSQSVFCFCKIKKEAKVSSNNPKSTNFSCHRYSLHVIVYCGSADAQPCTPFPH